MFHYKSEGICGDAVNVISLDDSFLLLTQTKLHRKRIPNENNGMLPEFASAAVALVYSLRSKVSWLQSEETPVSISDLTKDPAGVYAKRALLNLI
ncbi:unnamed protein product [Larinioides sclopetarius]|uniref:Uncharacterized protein n=1 Tax=Larinioides sclopetarius TaxID=280406 RepID=A0AAV1ZX54_9ARAC